MTYDVIVVGAGSAGCVLADRLSERGMNILVLEAGPGFAAETSADLIRLKSASFFDALSVQERTWPQLMARRTKDAEPQPYMRGRGVGGSSSVNAMVGLWGEVEDFDSWERDFGCNGWSWLDVEPYFRRIDIPLTKAETGGDRRLGSALVETARNSGWHLHRGPYPLGALGKDVGPAVLTRTQDGHRVSAADHYLARAILRENVHVRVDSLVDTIVLEGGSCRGVVLADGTEFGAHEVVLCAGALHTPAILMRSRVERQGLGQGLQDHASASFHFDLVEECDTSSLAISSLARFSSGREIADLQLLPIDHLGSLESTSGTSRRGTLDVALMYVQSRGSVRLKSMDPRVDPIVAFDLLSHDDDVERLSIGVRQMIEFVESPVFARAVSRIDIDREGRELSTLDRSESGIATWLSSATGDYVHASGTCAMGDPSDTMTVVDPSCRVVGISGLRVCDASVFPRIPRANTYLPVLMAAELLADRWM